MDIFIALVDVEGSGLKHAEWRNRANYLLVLFICIMVLADGAGRLGGVDEVSQRLSELFFHLSGLVFVTAQ